MAYVNLLQVVYPVGSLYLSSSATSPASIIGGTWSAITGRVLRANNTFGTGGVDSQSIDFDHSHLQSLAFTVQYSNANGLAYTNGGTVPIPGICTNLSSWKGFESLTGYVGTKKVLGTKTISHLPAYQNIYCWRRTA